MGIITSGNLKVISDLKIKYVTALQIVSAAQKHGECMVKGILEDGTEAERILSDQKDIPVSIIGNGDTNEILFKGIVREAKICSENSLYYIEMNIVTASELLDRKKNQRSFQNTLMTYKQVVEQIVESYGGITVTFSDEAGNILQEPLIQYGETDWEFLLRLGSRLHIPLFVNCFTGKPDFNFGMREGRKTGLEIADYHAGISSRYYETKSDSIAKADFLYYIIISDKAFQIGDCINIGTGNYTVFKKCATLVHEELKYTYWIGNSGNWHIPEISQEQLIGMEFAGTVINTQAEKINLRLDIDGMHGGAEYEWDWMPVSGNIMYSMPEKGTSVRLCFGSETAIEGAAVVNARENGVNASGEQNRTFTTGTGKKIEWYPAKLSLQGGGGQTGISDNEKICFNSTKKMEITAAGAIRLSAASIQVNTPLEINMFRSESRCSDKKKRVSAKGTRSNPPTGGTDSGFTMNFEFNALSKSGVLCGSDLIRYRPFMDAPGEIIIEPSFDWGAFAGNILAGLTVVACVTVLAAYGASIVFSGGTTAVFAPYVVGGMAGICGTAFVAGQARNDYQRGEVSSVLNYAAGGAIGSTYGAVTAAAFCMVPFSAEVMVSTAVPPGMTGMFVGNMFISSDAMMTAAMGTGYTVTFSNMAVTVNDSMEYATGYNAIREAIGDRNYGDLRDVSQMGALIYFWEGIQHPQIYTNIQNAVSNTQNVPYEGGTPTQGVGNPVTVEGRGNTGRTTPNTLNEQMAMHQVQSNPLEGATKVPLEMIDPRWPAAEGWVKMQSVVQNADGTKTTIHYVYNEITGVFDDFKFK